MDIIFFDMYVIVSLTGILFFGALSMSTLLWRAFVSFRKSKHIKPDSLVHGKSSNSRNQP